MMTFEERCRLFGSREGLIRAAVENSPCREEMEFLYATMPLSDAANYPPELFERYAAHGRFLRENVDWCKALSPEQYLNDVLYHRVNSEDISDCRGLFYERLWPLVQGCTMEEAAKRINYWCLEEATYRLTDERTASPLTVLRCAFGRCGEESTFAVTALRSVGIPARQVYSPKWPHCDDNHAWVEVCCDGKWHYLGACEPEETLDRGWFTAAASRAMLVHSRSFGDKLPGEEYISREGCMSLWNQLPRYADCCTLTVQINENGAPLAGVLVKAELLNYAQFSPIAKLITDEQGRMSLTTGLGDLRLHCVKDGRFLCRKVDLRTETAVTIDFSAAVTNESEEKAGLDFEMQPPKDDMRFLSAQSEETKRLRQQKFDAALAKRREKEAKYLTQPQGEAALLEASFTPEQAARGGAILAGSYGNENTLLSFLLADEQRELRLALLENLSVKDRYDCDPAVLAEAFDRSQPWKESCPPELFAPYLMNPRVGLEKLTLWRKELPERFSHEEKAQFTADPRSIGRWIREHISHHPAEEYDELLTCPLALLELGSGSQPSQHILFVALCRSLGIPARLAPDDRRPQYWDAACGQFRDGMPKGEEGRRLAFTLTSHESEPWLYTQNWTLGRLEQGEYQTLDLMDKVWTDNRLTLELLEGNYRLLTCKRMPTGALFAKEYRFTVAEGGENSLTIAQRQAKLTDLLSDKPIPDFSLYREDGTVVSMAALTAGKASLLLWLEEGKEPTEHILNEMEDLLDGFCSLPAQIFFVVKEKASLRDARIARALAHIPGIQVLYDDFRDTMSMLARRMYIDPDKLPIVVLCSQGLNGIYGSSGYNVGLGDLILKIFGELR